MDPVASKENGSTSIAPEKARHTWLSSFAIEVVAGMSSLMAGGITAWRMIKELAHRNTSAIDFIEDIKNARREAGPKLAKQIVAGTINSDQAYSELQKVIQWNASSVDERMVKAGAGPLWKKFGLLRPHQKWDVALSTLASGGIALGAVLLGARELISDSDRENSFLSKVPDNEKVKEEEKSFVKKTEQSADRSEQSSKLAI